MYMFDGILDEAEQCCGDPDNSLRCTFSFSSSSSPPPPPSKSNAVSCDAKINCPISFSRHDYLRRIYTNPCR